jgi:hypothetical protein
MCDYSLEMYRSRPAQVGEEYSSHRFPSGSVGFVSPGDTSVAVCMACDTRLKLENISEHVQRTYGVTASEEVVFIRREVGPHHDAVRFANGAELTLQQLGPNVKAGLIDGLTTPAWTRETVEAL